MIVDIGGGTTKLLQIALAGVCDKSVKLLVMFSQMTSFTTCVRNTIFVEEKAQKK
jgi:actin-like ATPase involved in cell morphogenesis